jgi:hypothetical protein
VAAGSPLDHVEVLEILSQDPSRSGPCTHHDAP